MTDGSVCLAYLHSDEVAHSWHMSLLHTLMRDSAGPGRMVRGGFLAMRCGTGGIVTARNDVAARFLDGDAEWLWIVDTDMGFRPDTLERLLAVADPEARPVVGALCFAQMEHTPDGMGGYHTRAAPTLYQWARDEQGRDGFAIWRDYPRDQLVQVGGTGAACIVVHRSALEKVADEYGPGWYTRMTVPSSGQLLGEDLSFCARLGALGIPVHVHTAIKTSHLKPIWLAEEHCGVSSWVT